MARAALGVLISAVLVLAGCSGNKTDDRARPKLPASSKTPTVAVQPLNKTCPITGEAVEPTITVSYKGQTVGFCCSECTEDWRKLTDDQKAAKLKKSM